MPYLILYRIRKYVRNNIFLHINNNQLVLVKCDIKTQIIHLNTHLSKPHIHLRNRELLLNNLSPSRPIEHDSKTIRSVVAADKGTPNFIHFVLSRVGNNLSNRIVIRVRVLVLDFPKILRGIVV